MAPGSKSPALSDLPSELLMHVLSNLDVWSRELPNMRAVSQQFNTLVITNCAQLTKQRRRHPFSSIRMGLDPALVHGLNMVSHSTAFKDLPYQVIFNFEELSSVASPRRLNFEYIKEGSWEARYGTAWGALQLLLIGMRNEGPVRPDDADSDYLRDRFRETRSLDRHQDRYSRYLLSHQGQHLLKDIFARFPSLSHLSIAHIGMCMTYQSSLKRSMAEFDGIALDTPDTSCAALKRAIEQDEQMEERCARPCEYQCLQAMLRAFAGTGIKFTDIAINKLDGGGLIKHEIPDILVECGLGKLTTLDLEIGTYKEMQLEAEDWRRFLAAASSLRSINFRGSLPHLPFLEGASQDELNVFFARVLDGQYWPHLESFSIEFYDVPLVVLSTAIVRHSKTLRKMRYAHCHIMQPEEVLYTLKQWRKVLRLESAYVELPIIEKIRLESLAAGEQDAKELLELAKENKAFGTWDFGDYLLQ